MKSQNKVRVNLAANLMGRVVALLATFAFVPAYLRLLGPEAFGLVGFYTALVSILALTDVGLSATLSRELARLSALGDIAHVRDTLRTLEIVYGVIVLATFLSLYVAAPYIATEWIQTSQGAADSNIRALRLMSIAAALQLGGSIYQGSLVGLQRHIRLNVVLGTSAALRGAFTIAYLVLVSNTAEAFFGCQVVVSLLTLLWVRTATWSAINHSVHAARFRHSILTAAWRYASGMLVMTLTGTALMQSDKFVLSRLLPIEVFGFYTLAWTLAQIPLSLFSTPIQNTFFPRMTQLVAARDEAGLTKLYHTASQIMALAVIPAGAVIATFPEGVLNLWLGPGVAPSTAPGVLRILVVGSTLSALTAIPYSAQLAHGWTRIPVLLNVAAVAVFVPLLTVLARSLGMRGAGFAWLLLNVAYIVFIATFMHRRILVGNGLKWSWYSVGAPFAIAFGTTAALASIIRLPLGRAPLAAHVFLIWVAAQLATTIGSPFVRSRLRVLLVRRR